MNSMSDNGVVKGKWTEFVKNFVINGGKDNKYKGYAIKHAIKFIFSPLFLLFHQG